MRIYGRSILIKKDLTGIIFEYLKFTKSQKIYYKINIFLLIPLKNRWYDIKN